MAIKDLCFKLVHKYDLKNSNWIILEFIQNIPDTLREFILNNATHLLSEFVSNNTKTSREILSHKTPFVKVDIKQCWHSSLRATAKQHCTCFSEFISHNALSGSYYKIIQIFSEFIWNNIDTFRVATKQKVKNNIDYCSDIY